MSTPELAVVIVSYRTRDVLRDCLASIMRARQAVSFEVWVVDNASGDGTVEMVAAEFPQVHLVASPTNDGFARANNRVLREVRSDYVLLLNPDTVVLDDAFTRPIEFLRRTPRAGMVTCRLVKRDGTLDLACRRAFPTPFDGFCRAAGLSRLFPRSPRFARYNLTYLDEMLPARVDAVNGAFMLVRREAMAEVGLLDEDYFMYMEDLDWCFRFATHGWHVYYDPSAVVVHLKGESGKQSSEAMIRAFFVSMEIFHRKHLATRQPRLAALATRAGIRAWMYATLARNALRGAKRVTP
ncbi:MAG TPA: glycosyltransferase family 2 protein [Gemmatimonadaceae bacterium]|nr:glycosyltransferase family 2 protein [Gemmatimonadaceae bacterium]